MGSCLRRMKKEARGKLLVDWTGDIENSKKKKKKACFKGGRVMSRHTARSRLPHSSSFKLQVCGQIMTFTGKTRRKRQRRSDPSDETDFLQADTPDSALAAIDQLIRRFNLDPSMFKFKDDDPGPCLSLSLFRLGVLLC